MNANETAVLDAYALTVTSDIAGTIGNLIATARNTQADVNWKMITLEAIV